MSLLAVDLAASFSAACLLHDGQVMWQGDSWQKPQAEFVDAITDPFDPAHPAYANPDVLVIEDLPARLPFMTNVRDVCRLQGRIVERMWVHGAVDKIMFVQPATWQAHYTELGMKRGAGPAVVVPVAAQLGYTPPDLTARTGKGERATARKVATDYCAAYLIGRWAQDTVNSTGKYDASRTSRYTKV